MPKQRFPNDIVAAIAKSKILGIRAGIAVPVLIDGVAARPVVVIEAAIGGDVLVVRAESPVAEQVRAVAELLELLGERLLRYRKALLVARLADDALEPVAQRPSARLSGRSRIR